MPGSKSDKDRIRKFQSRKINFVIEIVSDQFNRWLKNRVTGIVSDHFYRRLCSAVNESWSNYNIIVLVRFQKKD